MIVGDWASWSKFGGRPEEALRALDAAMMRDPFPPIWFWHVRGSALFDLQHYEEAVSAFQQRISEGSYLSHAFLAAAYAMVGYIDNARHQAELALVIQSDFSVKRVSYYLPYTDQAALDRYMDAMRMAGLPEGLFTPRPKLALKADNNRFNILVPTDGVEESLSEFSTAVGKWFAIAFRHC